MSAPSSIRCDRFELVLFSVAFMEAVLARNLEAARLASGARLPAGDDWLEGLDFLFNMRLEQITRDPASHEWLARGIVLPDGTLAGHIGFHGPPDADGRAELGYTVFAQWRRRGFASEAARGMMRWARERHGTRRFRVSIAPDNVPSLAMASMLGFVQTGEQMDEIDGLEYVFDLETE